MIYDGNKKELSFEMNSKQFATEVDCELISKSSNYFISEFFYGITIQNGVLNKTTFFYGNDKSFDDGMN